MATPGEELRVFLTDSDMEEKAEEMVKQLLDHLETGEWMDFVEDRVWSLFRGDPIMDGWTEEEEISDAAHERYVDLEATAERAIKVLLIERLVEEVSNGRFRKNARRESHPSNQFWQG